MMRFRKSGFNDSKLPVGNPKPPEVKDTAPTMLKFEKHFIPRVWPEFWLHNFYEKQWRYLVPVFTPSTYDYNLSPECIFPFSLEDSVPKVGAFSSVFKVK